MLRTIADIHQNGVYLLCNCLAVSSATTSIYDKFFLKCLFNIRKSTKLSNSPIVIEITNYQKCTYEYFSILRKYAMATLQGIRGVADEIDLDSPLNGYMMEIVS